MYVTQTNNRTDLFSLEISYVKNVPTVPKWTLKMKIYHSENKSSTNNGLTEKNVPVPMALFENLNIFNKLVFCAFCCFKITFS